MGQLLLGPTAPLTHRQFLLHMARAEQRLNEPDRADHYAMQVAASVHRVHGINASLDSMKLRFARQQRRTDAEVAADMKHAWFGRLGVKLKEDGTLERRRARPPGRKAGG